MLLLFFLDHCYVVLVFFMDLTRFQSRDKDMSTSNSDVHLEIRNRPLHGVPKPGPHGWVGDFQNCWGCFGLGLLVGRVGVGAGAPVVLPKGWALIPVGFGAVEVVATLGDPPCPVGRLWGPVPGELGESTLCFRMLDPKNKVSFLAP